MKKILTRRHKRLIELLIEARKARHLRQTNLARRLRRHQSWVARLESGQRRIDVVEFLALSEAIGFDPNKILREVQTVGHDRALRARGARAVS